ncbi:MAG: hypothetical protein COU68_04915 [Candidatus Pacebacteria bacterium CG10_big_fil_rev_8_21_14_0_10_45_6]|nr:MAG: hypothetical protein COU68_04915 [Candidatus Pacebacteria bacterium CG10_big_fil_rev_8_21_14_0_10_45_6]
MTKNPQPYINIPYLPLENQEQDTRHGAHFFRNVKQLQVGFGAKVFRVDRDGMWAGAENFASAPWRVDWDGNMTANSVTLTGYLAIGEALGDTQTSIGAGGLSAISANIGAITAGSITGITITGGTVRTSSGSTRVEMNGTDNSIYHYQSGVLRTAIGDGIIAFFRPSDGVSSGSVYGSSTSLDIDAGNMVRILGQYIFGSSGLNPASTVAYTLGSTSAYWGGVYTDGIALKRSSGTNYSLLFGALGSGSNVTMTLPSSIGATGTVLYNTGSGILGWKSVPSIHYGYVNSGASMGTNPSGFSVSSGGTGIYTVTHNLGTTAYSVMVTPVASVVKNITVSARSSNSFTVRVANLSDTLENNDFMFILTTA